MSEILYFGNIWKNTSWFSESMAIGPILLTENNQASASIQSAVRRLTARSRDTFPIALKFERHVGSSALKIAVKFQSDAIITLSFESTRLYRL